MYQYCYIIISWSPQSALGFTLCVVHSMSFNICIMTCIHHDIIQITVTSIKKMTMAHLFIPFSSHWSLYSLHSFTFYRKLYSYNHTGRWLFFSLASFTNQYVLQVPPCLFMARELISFYYWKILCCNVYTIECLSIHPLRGILVAFKF